MDLDTLKYLAYQAQADRRHDVAEYVEEYIKKLQRQQAHERDTDWGTALRIAVAAGYRITSKAKQKVTNKLITIKEFVKEELPRAVKIQHPSELSKQLAGRPPRAEKEPERPPEVQPL
jgi:hypothetical protein